MAAEHYGQTYGIKANIQRKRITAWKYPQRRSDLWICVPWNHMAFSHLVHPVDCSQRQEKRTPSQQRTWYHCCAHTDQNPGCCSGHDQGARTDGLEGQTPPERAPHLYTCLMFHYKWHFSIYNILDLYLQKEMISILEYQSLQHQWGYFTWPWWQRWLLSLVFWQLAVIWHF